jgi:serine/threonine-protein kinase
LEPGAQVGPYEIVELLGTGGMGEVYKARDSRLRRLVAIKTLKGPHAERFLREARALAALTHPNICALYDIGPDYLVMEYVEGEPLKGPLPAEEVVKIAMQICSALQAAHEKGFIHRDLKPANILLTRSGVKLLDFGLAKALAALPQPNDATLTEGLTQAGMVLGTPNYMSPEQASSGDVDERSDLFSMGAILYELLSGQRPFRRPTIVDTLAAVLRDQPAPLSASIPGPLRSVVEKCMQKDPARRFPSAAQLAETLQQTQAQPAGPPENSIAILPFANLSADKDNEYFSDGLAEEIINALSHVPELRIAARTSSFAFRGKDVGLRQIAEQLGVANILEGSMRRAGNRVRITAQLVQAATGFQIWSDRYDRELTDIFAIQDEIAQAIVENLKVKLSGPRLQAVPRRPVNLEAYHCYLQGRYHIHRYNPASVRLAGERFRFAIQLDPGYAPAYFGLADHYYVLAVTSGASPVEVLPAARAAACKAVELDPSLADAHAIAGAIEAMHYNWPQAEQSMRHALALNPGSDTVRYYYGAWFLRPMGRLEEAVVEIEQCLAADPLSSRYRFVYALTLLQLGRVDEASTQARQILDMEPNYPFAHWVHSVTLFLNGQPEGALHAAEEGCRIAPDMSILRSSLGWLLARMGRRDEARNVLDEILEQRRTRYVNPSTLATFYSAMDDPERAWEELERAASEHEPNLIQLLRDPMVEPFRKDPRWPAFLRRLNLPGA